MSLQTRIKSAVTGTHVHDLRPVEDSDWRDLVQCSDRRCGARFIHAGGTLLPVSPRIAGTR